MSRCSKYHILISCLVDGELNSTERCELEEHFRKCDHCLSRYNKYKQISSIVGSIYTNQPITVASHSGRSGVNELLTKFFNASQYLTIPLFSVLILVSIVTWSIKPTSSGKSSLMIESSASVINLPLSTYSCFDSTITVHNRSRFSHINDSYKLEEIESKATLPVYESPLFNDKLTDNVKFYQSSQFFME